MNPRSRSDLEADARTRATHRMAEFLATEDEQRRGRVLSLLIEEDATPVFRRILERKAGGKSSDQAAVEDVVSTARVQLIERLTQLKDSARRPDALAADEPSPIRDLRSYAGALAYSAWSRHLSRLHPSRAILANQLRHLVEDRRGRRGLACWPTAEGLRLCGLSQWRSHSAPVANARAQRLADSPLAAAQEALESGADPQTHDLADLLVALFHWLGGPIEWHDLTSAVAHCRGADHAPEVAGEQALAAVGEISDGRPDPHEELRWREYLAWLWRAVRQLSLRQRNAFTLHSHTVFDWEQAGIASIREMAELLGMPAETFAALWPRLPLDDLTIGARLGATRQQVINLRRVARDTLGRAWREWNVPG